MARESEKKHVPHLASLDRCIFWYQVHCALWEIATFPSVFLSFIKKIQMKILRSIRVFIWQDQAIMTNLCSGG